jgi:hypothetical protein
MELLGELSGQPNYNVWLLGTEGTPAVIELLAQER